MRLFLLTPAKMSATLVILYYCVLAVLLCSEMSAAIHHRRYKRPDVQYRNRQTIQPAGANNKNHREFGEHQSPSYYYPRKSVHAPLLVDSEINTIKIPENRIGYHRQPIELHTDELERLLDRHKGLIIL